MLPDHLVLSMSSILFLSKNVSNSCLDNGLVTLNLSSGSTGLSSLLTISLSSLWSLLCILLPVPLRVVLMKKYLRYLSRVESQEGSFDSARLLQFNTKLRYLDLRWRFLPLDLCGRGLKFYFYDIIILRLLEILVFAWVGQLNDFKGRSQAYCEYLRQQKQSKYIQIQFREFKLLTVSVFTMSNSTFLWMDCFKNKSYCFFRPFLIFFQIFPPQLYISRQSDLSPFNIPPHFKSSNSTQPVPVSTCPSLPPQSSSFKSPQAPPISPQINSHCTILKKMQRNISRNASEIISLFTTANQELQLESDKKELKKFKQTIEKKHKKILGEKYKAEESLDKNIQNAEKFKTMEDHRMPIDQFVIKYQTDKERGLTDEEAARRLREEGENKLTERKGTHWSIQLLKEMTNPFALLLWAGAILAFVAYGLLPSDPSNLYLGIVLIVIILFVGLLTFYQNMKSQAIMASFKDFIPPSIVAIRSGRQITLDSTKLVRGDLIKVDTGKKIPADIRIIASQGMKVDNSSLTGETELLVRVPECTNPNNPLETKNIAFFSTLCKEGSGRGIVMFTGDNTFIGQIATLATLATQEISPLAQEIDRFVKRLAIFAITSGVVFFVAGFIIGYPPITNFIFAVGIIVGNVPNGLLAEVTIALTLTAKKLSFRKVLCKTLQAVETLGSTSCICSDKTGTLTQNKMTAVHLWYDEKIFEAANRQKCGPDYRYDYDVNSPGFKCLMETAIVCSVAKFDLSVPIDRSTKITNNKDYSPQVQKQKLTELQQSWQKQLQTMLYLDMPTDGDASQSALIKFFQPVKDILTTRSLYKLKLGKGDRQCKIPFNSTNKYAFSINYVGENELAIFTKGAPERIWEMCTHVMVNGKPQPKNAEHQASFKKANLSFGRNGERVLGFAQLRLPKDPYSRPDFDFNMENPNFPFREQVFVGIVSLADPPRDSVPFSVLKCQAAGIKVIMVTGDQPVTAAAIARQCHIITEKKTVNEIAEEEGKSFEEAFLESNAIVIHGDELTKMALEDQGLPESEQGKKLATWLTKPEIVFARTSPAQKLIIVKGCQKMNHIVAVTGDGVNDSPAIKKADIGIAMGITGTDVAKDAADMILLTDDFSAIVIGVQQGRRIFDNLKKAICYVMTSQIAEIAPFIALIIFNFPVPVSPIILLYIDLGTDLAPAVAYAYEQAELDLMTRKPRNKEDHLVTMKLMGQSYGNYGWCAFWGAMFNYFMVMNDFGFAPKDILGKNTIRLYKHNDQDIYNPTDEFYGNTKLSADPTKCHQNQQIDWLYTVHAHIDLRMSAFTCQVVNNRAVYTPSLNYSHCKIYQISPYSNRPVCYTTQAAKYAQSAFFYGVVVAQFFNCFICKTRKLSIIQHGIGNKMSFFGLIVEFLLVIVVAYFYPFNVAFGTRDCVFMHLGMMSIPFGLLNMLFDEFRRWLIRVLPPDEHGKPNFVERNTMW